MGNASSSGRGHHEETVDFGYLTSMAIYTGIIGLFGLLIPVVYIWGPAWRRRLPAAHMGDNRKDD